jgi:hypothetical protein
MAAQCGNIVVYYSGVAVHFSGVAICVALIAAIIAYRLSEDFIKQIIISN